MDKLITSRLEDLAKIGQIYVPINSFFDGCCEDIIGQEEAHILKSRVPKTLKYIWISQNNLVLSENNPNDLIPDTSFKPFFEYTGKHIFFKRFFDYRTSEALKDMERRGIEIQEPLDLVYNYTDEEQSVFICNFNMFHKT